MNDEELLRRLAAVAREEADDPRWDALADDALSDEDAAALEALAAADPEAAVALRAFTPLDAAAQDRFADAALAALARPTEQRGARVLPFRRIALWVVPLAAAAALAVFLLRPGSDLPTYRMEAGQGDRALRGAEVEAAAVPRYEPGSRLEIVLRPAKAVEGPVAARGFVRRGDDVTPWAVEPEVAPGGAVRVAGPIDALLPGVTGEVELWIAVGRPAALPDADAVRATPRGWQLLRYRLVRVPGG